VNPGQENKTMATWSKEKTAAARASTEGKTIASMRAANAQKAAEKKYAPRNQLEARRRANAQKIAEQQYSRSSAGKEEARKAKMRQGTEAGIARALNRSKSTTSPTAGTPAAVAPMPKGYIDPKPHMPKGYKCGGEVKTKRGWGKAYSKKK
jgi:hypothetical protein